MLDLIYIFILVSFGFVLVKSYKNKLFRKDIKVLNSLWLFHLLMTIGYFFLTTDGGGDAWAYWRSSKAMNIEEFWEYLLLHKGTYFMYALNYFPANVMGMSFLSNTILFSLFGFAGILFFYIVLRDSLNFNIKIAGFKLFPAVLFLPNLHFWSSGVGKDTIIFFSVGLMSFALQNISKRIHLLCISLFLTFMIRPHIFLFLLTSFGIAFLINGKTRIRNKFIVSIASGILLVLLAPIVIEYVKIDSLSFDTINSRSEIQAGHLSEENVGSRIDIAALSYPAKVLTFLYRPFFFDAKGLIPLIISFENLIVLILSIKVLMTSPVKTFRNAPAILKGLLLFMILGAAIFSLSLSNLGIIIRMKNMFMPGFLAYLVWSLSHNQGLKFHYNKILRRG